MTNITAHEALDRLGFEGLTVASAAEFQWSVTDQSHALGAGDLTALAFSALAAGGFVDVPFADVRDAALGRLGAAVSSSATRVVRVEAPPDVPLHVQLPDGLSDDDVAYVPEEDPGTAYLDLSRVPAVVVRAGADTVLLRASPGGLVVNGLERSTSVLAPLQATPDLATWTGPCRDPWVVEQVGPLVSSDEAWSRVVAAGMLARLQMPASGAQAREWLAAFREGRVDESVAGPRTWARALGAADRAAIEAHALAECAALRLDIEDAADDVHAGAEGWPDLVREVAHRRDDLEGVLVLLDAAGVDGPLRKALARLDREGQLLRLSLPADIDRDDERLRRAGLKDPDAWWSLAA